MYLLRKIGTEEYIGENKVYRIRYLTSKDNCRIYNTLKGAKLSLTTFKLFENGKRIEVKLEIITT